MASRYPARAGYRDAFFLKTCGGKRSPTPWRGAALERALESSRYSSHRELGPRTLRPPKDFGVDRRLPGTTPSWAIPQRASTYLPRGNRGNFPKTKGGFTAGAVPGSRLSTPKSFGGFHIFRSGSRCEEYRDVLRHAPKRLPSRHGR
jgi:hypothetical protein